MFAVNLLMLLLLRFVLLPVNVEEGWFWGFVAVFVLLFKGLGCCYAIVVAVSLFACSPMFLSPSVF